LSIIEAFSVGLPVIASNLGAMSELVTNGRTGKLFPAGSSEALTTAIDWAFANPNALQSMRLQARQEFELKYTAESNYVQLMRIYQEVLVADAAKLPLHRYALQN
jgi:glycosyltransferase involved in cell wall biosynthesis